MIKIVGTYNIPEKEALSARVTQLEEELQCRQLQMEALQAQHKHAEDRIKGLMEEANRLRSERTRMVTELNTKLREKDEQIATLTEENDSANEVIDRNEEARKALEWVLQAFKFPADVNALLNAETIRNPGLQKAMKLFAVTFHPDKFSHDKATGISTPRSNNEVKVKTEDQELTWRFGSALLVAKDRLRE